MTAQLQLINIIIIINIIISSTYHYKVCVTLHTATVLHLAKHTPAPLLSVFRDVFLLTTHCEKQCVGYGEEFGFLLFGP